MLQEWPEITILFCYITGFKELTTSCDPYDVVDFVNSLFSSFDKVRYYCAIMSRKFCFSIFLLFVVGLQAEQTRPKMTNENGQWRCYMS